MDVVHTDKECVLTSSHAGELSEKVRKLGDHCPLGPCELERSLHMLSVRLFTPGENPLMIGRYEVLRTIGSGGMGVVYEAFDPDLRRFVALKLLRSGNEARDRHRLLREAQAMAQIEHPCVVQVFDVGVHADEVYVAMELVDGTNLQQWLTVKPRRLAEILAVFCAAARGLAMVHRAGLVHRDFKPQNVLIGHDGRVRVGDFGLVGQADGGFDDSIAAKTLGRADLGAYRSSAPAGGTPRYMSPEQMLGEAIDARSDQYSFAVALYEACVGALPFEGASFGDLFAAKVTTTPSFNGRRALAPWLRAVLRKALASAPDDRYPTLDHVVNELSRDRLKAWKSGATLVALASCLALGAWSWSHHDPCKPPSSYFEALALDQANQPIQLAFMQSGRPYARLSWEQTFARLERYGRELASQRHHNCSATYEVKTQTLADFTWRSTCLNHHELHLRDLVSHFVQADSKTVEHALRAVNDLPPLRRCTYAQVGDAQTIANRTPEQSAAIDRVHAMIAKASTAFRLGHYRQGLDHGRLAVDAARELDDAATLAVALFAVARNQGALINDGQEPTRAAEEAADRAESSGQDELLAEIWTFLVKVSNKLDDPASPGHARLRRAQSALHRVKDPLDLRAQLAASIGTAHGLAGQLKRAQTAMQEALQLWHEAPNEHEIQIIDGTYRLARAQRLQMDYRAAKLSYEQALQASQAVHGVEHPITVRNRFELALTLIELGEVDQALPLLEAVEDQVARSAGENVSYRIDVLLAAARAKQQHQDFTGAQSYFDRALKLARENPQQSRHAYLDALMMAGFNAFRRGLFAQSLEHYQEGLQRSEQAGSSDRLRANFHAGVGECLLRLERLEPAHKAFAAALAIYQEAGAGRANEAYAHKGLGQLAFRQRRYRTAEHHLETARQSWIDHPSDPLELADASWTLARVRRALGRPTTEVNTLAESALATFTNSGNLAQARDIQSFLALHRPPAPKSILP